MGFEQRTVNFSRIIVNSPTYCTMEAVEIVEAI